MVAKIQDQAIEPQATGVQDQEIAKITPKNGGSETDRLKQTRLVQAATIKAETDNVDILEAFALLAEERPASGKAARKQEADRLNDQVERDARELFVQQSLNPEAPEESLLAIAEEESKNTERKSKQSYPFEVYIAATSPDLTEPERRDLAARVFLMEAVNELTEDISGLEIARDIALEVAIAPKAIWDAYQAFGSLNPFKAQENFAKLATWFQGLSAEEKVDVFPVIQEEIIDAMPRSRAVVFLRGLLDPAAMSEGEFDLGVFGAIDSAAIGAGLIGTAIRLRKILNPIKVAARGGSRDQATSANMSIMQGLDEGVGESVGVDRNTAMNNSLLFDSSAIDDAAAAGDLSPSVHERIFAFRDRLKEAFGNLAEGKTFVREGFIDSQDKSLAINRIGEEYGAYVATRYQDKGKIVNLDSKKITSDGVEFEFTVTNPDGSEFQDTYKGIFTVDDIGYWKTLPRHSSWLSERAQARGTDFMSTVVSAIRLDNTAAAVQRQLGRAIKDATKPLRRFGGKSRKERIDEVDKVLLSGDDMGREFTPQQLRAGVNGIKLDEDQIEAYYNLRGVMNGLGILRDMETRRGMVARGVRTVSTPQGENFFGTPLGETAADARRSLVGKNNIFKIDAEDGGAKAVNQLDLDAEYAKGFRLVRLEQDTIFPGGRFQHVLTRADSLSDLPTVVTDLKKGYIPRVNPKATWFVQAFTPSSLDGVKDVTRKAVRSFDNKAEADAFAARLSDNAADEGFGPQTTFRSVEDGELEAFRAGDTGMTQVGGLIYGKRARNKIPHNDGDANEVPRTSALEAIELSLENTKNFMTRSEWRLGQRKKWENTAEMLLGTRVSFDEPGLALKNTELRTAHEKISNFSGFMDKSERAWEQTVKGMYEWALKDHKIPFTDKRVTIGRNRISDFVLSQRQKDPVARLRSATFHTLLGFFNPIQLWVQAQGAAVAMSIGATTSARAAKVFQRQGALTMIQHVNFDDSKQITEAIAKGFGYGSVDEMRATKQLWDKSGLYDSVLSSADVEAAARGFPTTAGALKRFADSGLMFFRAGELFNRRFAFLTAVDELGGAQRLLADDTLFKEALDRANNLILNLGKSNRASWQKGLASIPTQFMQIQAKTIESVLGWNGALNKGDRMKLLAGQTVLYGAAGMFGGQWAARQLAAMAGKDQIDVNEASPEAVAAVTGGFTDWFLAQMGADVTGADRGALLNGLDQTIISLLTEETTAFRLALGPSAVGPERVWKKLQEISTWAHAPQDINGVVSFEPQDVTDTLKFLAEAATELAPSPFATGRQIDLFFMMRDLGRIRDANGNLISAPRDGFNWQTEWATLMGFKPNELQRKFDLSSINENVRKTVEFRTAVLLKAWDSFLMDNEKARQEGRDMTEDEIRRHEKRRNVIVNSIVEPQVRQMVLESFRNRLEERRTGNTQMDRQQQRYYDNMILDLANEFTKGTRIIQTREQE